MKKVEILEAEACPDHIHMLVSIPPNLSVSQFVGYLKGKSSLMIFDRHANLKYKYGNRSYRYRRNRLQQNFTVDAPNKVWVSDITYMRVNEDFVSVCVIIDLYARKVVSYAISKNGNTALVKETFQKAYDLRCPDEGLIFHSDQGTMYAAFEFRKMLRDLKVVQSFSNPGTPYDNAVAESFFSIMKREELSHNWYHTMEELDKTISDFISFFNGYRPLQKLGNLTPDQYESLYQDSHK